MATSKRIANQIEDIPEHINPVVIEYIIQGDYYHECKIHVKPVVPDALPNAAL